MMMADNPRIDELRRRIDLDPASIAFAALAEEYRRAGSFDEAIATCEAGLKRHPSYLSARVTLGRALIEVGRYEEARDHLEFVVRAAPENLAAIRGLAEIHNRRRDAEFKNQPDPPAALSGHFQAAEPIEAATSSPGVAPSDPALDAQVHALEAFLHAVERARTLTSATV
jgi:tetratricopeptide (TPR) repeat protein